MQFEMKKGLVRATTFDDRRTGGSGGGFQMLSRRAHTFVGSSKQVKNATGGEHHQFSDIIYRKYFGMEDLETKHIPPLTKNKLCAISALDTVPEDSVTVDENDSVVVVDTFSTGALLANRLHKMGYKVICVLSGDLKNLMDLMPEGVEIEFERTFVLNTQIERLEAIDSIVAQLSALDLNILAVLAGAETGVELADQLSEAMNLRTNGTALSEARRNKYVMGETIRAAGLRAVKQLKATSWGEIEEWLAEWNPDPFKVIVKPMDSAGSDDVTLCGDIDQVKGAFGNIMGKVNGLGIVNRAVLVQEYLEGDEYVIDMVSRDGVHKVAGIWLYDRRAVNGAGFVCFGQRLMTIDEDHCRELVDYQKKVISALGIVNGPTHGEVKWCRGEPVLVEVGARCQGGDGLWVRVAEQCLGYSQIGMTVSAYLQPGKFHRLPDYPSQRRAFGELKWLVNYRRGIFRCVDESAQAEMLAFSSYIGHQIFFAPGKEALPTQNCFTWGGCVLLVNKVEAELKEQSKRLEDMEKAELFQVDSLRDTADKSLVIVVDPFSTGAILAADLYKAGYSIIAMYSAQLDQLANVQNLVPTGMHLVFETIIAYDKLDVLLAQIQALGHPVLAVLAGAETGVELADQLSEAMNLRTNGTALSEARRNKYVMGETIRAAGLRAVKQLKATSWGEIEEWLAEWNPDPFKVIVKPMDSAGSDDVTLCGDIDQVKGAFGNIMGKVNGLGIVNRAVLVQEYLEGDEYVIDMVSRDGVHKVAGIWLYDRRAVNGAGFVCFGQRLMTIDEDHCRELVDYQKKVISALGIVNGPTHGEVKWCRGEPVLVEVGARCHGAEGMWQIIADYGYGYNQVQVAIDAYLHPQKFFQYPDEPMEMRSYGRLAFLINYEEGLLSELNNELIEEIRRMKSFLRMDVFVAPNTHIRKTIDCFTFGGVIRLTNEDPTALQTDYDRIREMERAGLFVITSAA